MNTANNILLVRVPGQVAVDGRELRDYILESLAQGVLVLTEDTSFEVIELPPLSGVTAMPAEESREPEEPEDPVTDSCPLAEGQSDAGEKRAIVQRLKDYRAVRGLGSLEAVSVKTAHFKGQRISADRLRDICADRAPRMDMAEWRKITKALDALDEDTG